MIAAAVATEVMEVQQVDGEVAALVRGYGTQAG
jgi:hypothetical protein